MEVALTITSHALIFIAAYNITNFTGCVINADLLL
jgi:hypothetical protein